jgi:uncharacterized protein YegJ (DUF2314 family)
MEELFRFLLTRPAERVDPEDRSVPLEPSKEYGTELKRARGSSKPGSALKQAAERHAASEGALHSLDDLKLAESLQKLSRALDDSESVKLAELTQGIKELFGSDADEVVKDDRFKHDRTRIADALITNTILGDDRNVSTDDAASIALAMAVVDRVAAGDEALDEEGSIADAMARILVLPREVFPLPGPLTRGPEPSPPTNGKPTHDVKRAILDQRNRLLATYTMLTRVSPEHLAEPSDAQIEAYEAEPAKVSLPPMPTVRDYDRSAEEEVEREPHERMEHESLERGAAIPDRPTRAKAPNVIDEAGTTRTAAHIVGAPLLLRDDVVEGFGRDQRTVLEERGLDLTRVSVPTVLERLGVELQELEIRTVEMNGATGTEMIRVGKSLLPKDATIIGAIGATYQLPEQVPKTHGDVAPAGIGDLLIVRQALKRYEARELAHVENVLQGEYKERSHRRARTTEETITTEVETKREEERDLQSTERFELKTESSEVLKEDTSLKVGLAVSGKYGPVVEFKASTDFAMNHAKEESKKVASSFSKDVTTRASSRISERRREERILKTIEVFEEANKHGIDNKDGNGHVVGQYQWLDKIFEAQVFNYGKRLLFDFMLPEPAAFLLHALTNGPKPGAELVKPQPFTLRATDISEWNYTYYAKQYGAVGIAPPPQPYVTISKAVDGKGTQDDGATKALEVPMPDGYQAISAFTTAWYNRWPGGTVDVTIGDNQHRFSDNGGWFASMSNEVGSVPFAMKTWKASAFAVTFELHCQRTQRALDDWKLKTHAAILTAYEKQLADYEDKLAELEIQAGIQIQGRNPAENERLVRAELKKGAISLFTGQHYDLFGAIALSVEGYPQANLPEAAAEGRYIRFFEQAFEWEQMMFFFYPYYWGRKPNWIKRALLQDVDPLFAEFLKSGSVRIVVSVRPGFEQAVAHFLDTGEIWNGGNLPPISSPLYLSIIEEIRERDQAPGAEVVHGDPWDVRLPTTLVRIRPDASLPSWKKNAQGEWVPA